MATVIDDPATTADLVDAIDRERRELRVTVDAVAKLVGDAPRSALAARVASLHDDVLEQLRLLDAVLDLVTEDDPGRPQRR